jgi:hypothetical protein
MKVELVLVFVGNKNPLDYWSLRTGTARKQAPGKLDQMIGILTGVLNWREAVTRLACTTLLDISVK